LNSEQCRIEFNLHILKVFELSRDAYKCPLALSSLSPLDFLGAAQAKVRSEAHFCFPESFRFPLGNLFLLAPNTICKKIQIAFLLSN